MSGLTVVHGALEGAAGDMSAASREIRARLDGLESALSPLSQDWTGEARSAYQAAKAAWDAAAAEMAQLMGDFAQAVIEANAEYRAADLRNAARF